MGTHTICVIVIVLIIVLLLCRRRCTSEGFSSSNYINDDVVQFWNAVLASGADKPFRESIPVELAYKTFSTTNITYTQYKNAEPILLGFVMRCINAKYLLTSKSGIYMLLHDNSINRIPKPMPSQSDYEKYPQEYSDYIRYLCQITLMSSTINNAVIMG
jgi:hypothetical protein